MQAFLQWLAQLSPPDTGIRGSWSPTFWYGFACVAGPIGFGVTVAGILTAIEKVFGIKLSSKGH